MVPMTIKAKKRSNLSFVLACTQFMVISFRLAEWRCALPSLISYIQTFEALKRLLNGFEGVLADYWTKKRPRGKPGPFALKLSANRVVRSVRSLEDETVLPSWLRWSFLQNFDLSYRYVFRSSA